MAFSEGFACDWFRYDANFSPFRSQARALHCTAEHTFAKAAESSLCTQTTMARLLKGLVNRRRFLRDSWSFYVGATRVFSEKNTFDSDLDSMLC